MGEAPFRHVRGPAEARHRDEHPASVLRARTPAEREDDRLADREWRRKSRWHGIAFGVSAVVFVIAVWAVALPFVTASR